MEIVLFNSNFSMVLPGLEGAYLPAHVLMADSVFYESRVAYIMLVQERNEFFSDEVIIMLGENLYRGNEEKLKLFADLKKGRIEVYRLKKIKHPDKKILNFIAGYKIKFKIFRKTIIARYSDFMNDLDLMELLPFYKNKLLKLSFPTNNNESNKERNILKNICDLLIDDDVTFSLTNHIENNLPFQTLTSPDLDDCAFIKIPLWKMPFIVETLYEHLNYTREQLQPVLQPFKDKLSELQIEFSTMDFTPENMPHFKQSIIEKINPEIIPVQQAIDESIYLNKIKNIYPENYGLTFCLGVAPVETIIKYYQQNQIIEPYEATEMKERISRERNLKSTNIFTYFEVHN